MDKTSNHYILIMCGGSGPRLWPLSRSSHPKQFLKLFGDQSLLQETYARYRKYVPAKNIFIISHQKYFKQLKKEFGRSVPAQNYLNEPDKKNTALAILYGTIAIQKINSNAVITAAPSDHFIRKSAPFIKDLQKAAKIASTTEQIVTIGIKPTYPNPGFGYILHQNSKEKYFSVTKFVEKPSVIDAELLIRKDALWNSGIYTFTPDTILKEFALHQKKYAPIIKQLSSAKLSESSLKSIYKSSPTLPIDRAISEKSSKLLTMVATFDWSDIGEWNAIWKHLNPKGDGISLLNKNGLYLSVNSKNCLVHGDKNKLIGLVGLNNLAIIDTPDSLLVCNLRDSFSVRDLVKKIVMDPSLKKYFLSKNDR